MSLVGVGSALLVMSKFMHGKNYGNTADVLKYLVAAEFIGAGLQTRIVISDQTEEERILKKSKV